MGSGDELMPTKFTSIYLLKSLIMENIVCAVFRQRGMVMELVGGCQLFAPEFFFRLLQPTSANAYEF